MATKLPISLIIPCRNEADGIAALVKKARRVAAEVIVVDNRSTDQTAAVAKQAGARVMTEKRVDALGIGYGYSLRKGMRSATHDLVVTIDGDGTYPLEQVRQAVAFLKREKLDLVLCSRFPMIDGQAISWWRQLGVWLLNLQARLLYNYPVQDILSGMWVLRKSALTSLKLTQGGWNLSPEIKLAAILHKKLRVGQFHIHHYEREYGQSKQKLLLTGLEHAWFIVSFRVLAAWSTGMKMVAGWLKPWLTIRKVEV